MFQGNGGKDGAVLYIKSSHGVCFSAWLQDTQSAKDTSRHLCGCLPDTSVCHGSWFSEEGQRAGRLHKASWYLLILWLPWKPRCAWGLSQSFSWCPMMCPVFLQGRLFTIVSSLWYLESTKGSEGEKPGSSVRVSSL